MQSTADKGHENMKSEVKNWVKELENSQKMLPKNRTKRTKRDKEKISLKLEY